MNSDQIGGVVRALLTAGAGYLVGSGIIPSETASQLVGAATTLVVIIWSVVSNRKPSA